jgi:hypothetical protein
LTHHDGNPTACALLATQQSSAQDPERENHHFTIGEEQQRASVHRYLGRTSRTKPFTLGLNVAPSRKKQINDECTVRATTSIVRSLRDIHFPGICPLCTYSGAHAQTSLSRPQQPNSIVKFPLPREHRAAKREIHTSRNAMAKEIRFTGTWEEHPVRNPLPDSQDPPRSQHVGLRRQHRARSHLYCKTAQGYPFPRHIPPTHM